MRNFTGAAAKEQQNAHIHVGNSQITSGVAEDLAKATFDAVAETVGARDFGMDERLLAKQRTAFLPACAGMRRTA